MREFTKENRPSRNARFLERLGRTRDHMGTSNKFAGIYGTAFGNHHRKQKQFSVHIHVAYIGKLLL